ncbi:MAG TPA: hypothetical protein PK079_23635 [Leptospiraceae bacterium]|nr:hypothetical protein [Leptospiraceae bacterium]HMW03641.1 hypothetical protein [Leptospiraceae bacterium]HMX31232.1 hypothetical protein [Leptospiraceae bacterium]HMY29438.1 hypothetical protein [Leptospiraceae bacterium]HMZ67539.1 hypothetical protein [Leptospiraceae bacterium]
MIEKKRRIKKYAIREWSEYQGQMNWYEANKISEELGMRLPTIEELKFAFQTKETSSWKKNGKCYWTCDENDYSKNYAFAFFIDSGIIFDYDKTINLDVRFTKDR